MVLSVLSRFNELEKHLRKNHFLVVERCRGRHAIQVTSLDESPTGLLTLVYLEADYLDGLFLAGVGYTVESES